MRRSTKLCFYSRFLYLAAAKYMNPTHTLQENNRDNKLLYVKVRFKRILPMVGICILRINQHSRQMM